jgi:hypothetical protein
MKDRVIRMMIRARDEAAGMVGGRGEKEGGLWNITERGKWRFIAWNRVVTPGRRNAYIKKRAREGAGMR